MIEDQQNPETLFILGAGASYDFGFPTGEELLRDIYETIKEIELGFELLHKYPVLIDQLVSPPYGITNYVPQYSLFYKYLGILVLVSGANIQIPYEIYETVSEQFKSGIPLAKSIDNFLHDNKDNADLIKLGKIIIAAALLKAERHGLCEVAGKARRDFIPIFRSHEVHGDEETLPPDFFELRKTWFVTFFRELRADNGREDSATGIEGFKARIRNIGFITFNYERSLEYLFRCAVEAYEGNLGDAQKRELIALFEGQIIHPYGSFGALDELEFATKLGNISDWEKIADNLQIFTEAGQEKDKAQNWFSNAKRAVFLGFGFHEQNLEYLGLPNSKPKRIFATTLGLSEFQRMRIFERLVTTRTRLIPAEKKALHQPRESSGYGTYLVDINCKDLLDIYAAEIFNQN